MTKTGDKKRTITSRQTKRQMAEEQWRNKKVSTKRKGKVNDEREDEEMALKDTSGQGNSFTAHVFHSHTWDKEPAMKRERRNSKPGRKSTQTQSRLHGSAVFKALILGP